jgi:imidazolonepropionase-like amidohydrolase
MTIRAAARQFTWLVVISFVGCSAAPQRPVTTQFQQHPLHELDLIDPPPAGSRPIAIVGARLIDGTDSPPIADFAVLINDDKISAAGARQAISLPPDAEVIDGAGLTLLPGLIDAHFHLDNRDDRPGVFLRHGVTSVRDPGAWIEAYTRVRQAAREGAPIPRLFLAGPHLDGKPPAYPKDALVVETPEATRDAVNRAVDQGATVIKVYFRLPIDLMKTAIETAHARGVPATGHLELVPATDAIRAGLDGIEHVTSFGTSLAEPEVARAYEASVRASNDARREGRYALWAGLDLDHNPRVKPTIELAVAHHVVLCPTLAVFEVRAGDAKATPEKVRAYENMLRFVGMYHRAGGTVVVGSHSEVPHAEFGLAYQRELELLVQAGLSPAEAIRAGTLDNARYFRAVHLGSVTGGTQADLIFVAGDPLKDISAMRQVKRVMLNGKWIDLTPPAPSTDELLRPTTRAGG